MKWRPKEANFSVFSFHVLFGRNYPLVLDLFVRILKEKISTMKHPDLTLSCVLKIVVVVVVIAYANTSYVRLSSLVFLCNASFSFNFASKFGLFPGRDLGRNCY